MTLVSTKITIYIYQSWIFEEVNTWYRDNVRLYWPRRSLIVNILCLVFILRIEWMNVLNIHITYVHNVFRKRCVMFSLCILKLYIAKHLTFYWKYQYSIIDSIACCVIFIVFSASAFSTQSPFWKLAIVSFCYGASSMVVMSDIIMSCIYI